MYYLSHYTEQAQTKAFDKAGAFFAFNKGQLTEQGEQGVKYASLGAGLICPVDAVKTLTSDLDAALTNGIAADVKENGIPAIILREMGNHECQITMDTTDAREALAGYEFTEDQFQQAWREFWADCVEHDRF